MTEPLTANEMTALKAVAAAGEVEPDLAQSHESVYPAGLTEDTLLALAQKQCLSKEAVRYCPCCPRCQGAALRINGRCPTCRSADLYAIPLAHHIPCAAVFEAPNGLGAVDGCPKCRSQVTANDDTLEAVGEAYRCKNCSAHFPAPAIRMDCAHCRADHALHDVVFQRFYRYRLTATGKAALERVRGD